MSDFKRSKKKKGAKVLITKNYFDVVLKRKITQGVIREVDVERAIQLANAGVGEIIEMSKSGIMGDYYEGILNVEVIGNIYENPELIEEK